jgi:hypothetical protein
LTHAEEADTLQGIIRLEHSISDEASANWVHTQRQAAEAKLRVGEAQVCAWSAHTLCVCVCVCVRHGCMCVCVCYMCAARVHVCVCAICVRHGCMCVCYMCAARGHVCVLYVCGTGACVCVCVCAICVRHGCMRACLHHPAAARRGRGRGVVPGTQGLAGVSHATLRLVPPRTHTPRHTCAPTPLTPQAKELLAQLEEVSAKDANTARTHADKSKAMLQRAVRLVRCARRGCAGPAGGRGRSWVVTSLCVLPAHRCGGAVFVGRGRAPCQGGANSDTVCAGTAMCVPAQCV